MNFILGRAFRCTSNFTASWRTSPIVSCSRLNQNPQNGYTSDSSSYKLRTLHPKESTAIGSSQAFHDLRFKPDDYRLFHKLDPSGYFIAATDSGEIAGLIGAPRITDTEGAIGFQFVNEHFKDKGIEEALWSAAMNHLGDRKISLEVSSEEAEHCTSLGFREAWRNGLFKGKGAKLMAQVEELTNSSVIRRIGDIPFSKVIYFDETIVGHERVNFLYKWTSVGTPSFAVSAYADDEVVGYGVLRELHLPQTYRLGPLYAINVAMAQVILVALISNIPDRTYYLQSPLDNLSFNRLLTDQLNMEQVSESVRMYNVESHGVPTHKVFGVACPDIGW